MDLNQFENEFELITETTDIIAPLNSKKLLILRFPETSYL
jgi:hypothetical protein